MGIGFNNPGSKAFSRGAYLTPGSRAIVSPSFLNPGSKVKLKQPIKPFTSNGATNPGYGSFQFHAFYEPVKNRTYYAWQAFDGNVRLELVCYYDHGNSKWSGSYRTGAHDMSGDAHGNGQMCRDANGYLHKFYGVHLNQANAFHYSTLNPDDISTWIPQNPLTTGLSIAAGGTEYPSVALVGSTLWLIYRYVDNAISSLGIGWTKAVPSANGNVTTWPALQYAVNAGSSNRLYWWGPFVRNGTELHFVATRTNNVVSNAQNVYYFILDTTTGNILNFARTHTATASGTTSVATVSASDCDTFYAIVTQPGATNIQISTLEFDTNGNPHVQYGDSSLVPSGWALLNIASFNGSTWTAPAKCGTIGSGGSLISGFYFGNLLGRRANGAMQAFWNDAADPIQGSISTSIRSPGPKGTWSKRKLLIRGRSDAAIIDPIPVANSSPGLRVILSEGSLSDAETAIGIGTKRAYAYGDRGFVNAPPTLRQPNTVVFSGGRRSGVATPGTPGSPVNGSLSAYANGSHSAGTFDWIMTNLGVLIGQMKYWEVNCDVNGANDAICVGMTNYFLPTTQFPGGSNSLTLPNFYASIGYFNSGNIYFNNAILTNIGTFTAGDRICCCMVSLASAATMFFRKNGGNWNGNVANNPATNTGGYTMPGAGSIHEWFIGCELETNNAQFSLKVPSQTWNFTPPAGATEIGL